MPLQALFKNTVDDLLGTFAGRGLLPVNQTDY